MATRARILPSHPGAVTAKALSSITKIPRMLPPTKTNFRGTPKDIIFNWGNSTDFLSGALIVNPPSFVAKAVSKLKSFTAFKAADIPFPLLTTSEGVMLEWIAESGIIARWSDNGRGGAGAFYIDTEQDFRDRVYEMGNPVFATKYIPKFDEYRIHVWNNDVLDIQQKKLKIGGTAHKIRSHENGYIFARQDIAPDPRVLRTALAAVACLRLDFGAVDVGWTRKTETATVYEVNTAPGLEGTTLDKYAAKILDAVEEFSSYV